LYKFLRKRDLVYIDVGARDGDSILYLIPLVKNSNIEIIAFEPNVDEKENFIKNMKSNSLENVSLSSFGISEETKVRNFNWDSKGINGGIVSDESNIGEWDEIKKFPCKKFKDLDKKLQTKMMKADFIKIDTEGYDSVVLNEFQPIIENNKPVVMVEWWPFTEKYIIEFCKKNEYIIYDPYHHIIRKNLSTQNNRVDDLILIPLSKVEAILGNNVWCF
jgi:FkbM family methyltransferase